MLKGDLLQNNKLNWRSMMRILIKMPDSQDGRFLISYLPDDKKGCYLEDCLAFLLVFGVFCQLLALHKNALLCLFIFCRSLYRLIGTSVIELNLTWLRPSFATDYAMLLRSFFYCLIYFYWSSMKSIWQGWVFWCYPSNSSG